MRKKVLFIIFLTNTNLTFGFPFYGGIGYGGPDGDMLTGARNTAAAADFLEYNLAPLVPRDSAKLVQYAFVYMITMPIYSYATTLQHEYFGHAYRARQYSFKNDLVMKAPFPYNLFLEVNPVAAGYVKIFPDRPLTQDEGLIIYASGIEAQNVASRDYRLKILTRDNPPFYYLFSRLSPFFYILTTSGSGSLGGDITGDPDAYRFLLEQKYDDNNALPVITMRAQSLWMLADPVLFGIDPWKLGEAGKFTFSTNYYLTPYGPEFQLDTIFLLGKKTIVITPRYGHGVEKANGGIGFQGRNLWQWNSFSFGLDADIWIQPKANGGAAEKEYATGGAIALQTQYRITRAADLEMLVGQKSAGFLPGRSLGIETYFFVGLNMAFGVADPEFASSSARDE